MWKPGGFEHKPHIPCGGFEHKHHIPCDCNPCDAPPPPCGEPNPLPPPIPPIDPYVPGCSPSQQMGFVVSRVNECIGRWNQIQANCYEAMRACVGACVAKDVYYDCDEVHLDNGYSATDQCSYATVLVKSCDKAGRPIRVKLGLAYDNATNSGLKQLISDYSFIKNANVIMTAVDPASAQWQGTSMVCGNPITSSPNAGGYVAGFNVFGNLEIFAGDVDITVLCQNKMVDVIGACTPVIINGEVTEQAKALTTKAAITAIGWKSSNNDKVLFCCGNNTEGGMQGITVANLLKDMGCTTAVITSLISNAEAQYSNGMAYLGDLTNNPTNWIMPENAAFWYVSKRPENGWCNDFESSIADLVQKTGFNSTNIDFLGHRVDEVTETANNAWELAQENADAIKTIEAEIDNINTEIDSINNSITEIKGDIQEINTQLNELDEKINQEIIDRTNGDNALDTAIKAETAARTQADSALSGRITNIENGTTELPYVKRAGDTMTGNLSMGSANVIYQQTMPSASAMVANKQYVDQQDNNLQDQIEGITTGTTTMPYVKKSGDTMTGPLTVSGADNTVTVGRGPTADLEVATKKYVDDAVSGGTSPGGDVSKEYVDGQIANVQGQIDGKVSKTGDTMTGNLVMSGAGIGVTLPNLPVNNTDATNKQYVDQQITSVNDQIQDIISGETTTPYVKKTGDTMTGDLTMQDNAVIKFNTDGSVYNDDTATVLKSEANGVTLMGNAVKVQTEDGSSVQVKNVANGTENGDAVNLSQLNEVSGRVTNIENGTTELPAYVKKAGDTMTGPLVLPSDPTENLQAATKKYVDSKVGGGGSEIAPWLPNASVPNFKFVEPEHEYSGASSGYALFGFGNDVVYYCVPNTKDITVLSLPSLSVLRSITIPENFTWCVLDQNYNIIAHCTGKFYRVEVNNNDAIVSVTSTTGVPSFQYVVSGTIARNGFNVNTYSAMVVETTGNNVAFTLKDSEPRQNNTLLGFYDGDLYFIEQGNIYKNGKDESIATFVNATTGNLIEYVLKSGSTICPCYFGPDQQYFNTTILGMVLVRVITSFRSSYSYYLTSNNSYICTGLSDTSAGAPTIIRTGSF